MSLYKTFEIVYETNLKLQLRFIGMSISCSSCRNNYKIIFLGSLPLVVLCCSYCCTFAMLLVESAWVDPIIHSLAAICDKVNVTYRHRYSGCAQFCDVAYSNAQDDGRMQYITIRLEARLSTAV